MDEPAASSLPEARTSWALPRWAAFAEALIVCGIPTQLAVAGLLLFVARMSPVDEEGLSLTFFATLSLLDTALVLLLIRVFLIRSSERPRDVFLGIRPIRPEVIRGVALVPVVFVVITSIVLTLRYLFPWMQTVPVNPMTAFMRTPLQAAVFLVVVVVAGGVREELQRAFILHRFEQRLGGAKVGLLVFSFTFGLLHVEQGIDVATAIGVLGFAWGVIYLQRRSAVLPMVNHASFNALQVIAAKSIGA